MSIEIEMYEVLLTQSYQVNKEDSEGRQPNFDGDLSDVGLLWHFTFSWSRALISILLVEWVAGDPEVEGEGEEEVDGGDEEVDEGNAGLAEAGDEQQHRAPRGKNSTKCLTLD